MNQDEKLALQHILVDLPNDQLKYNKFTKSLELSNIKITDDLHIFSNTYLLKEKRIEIIHLHLNQCEFKNLIFSANSLHSLSIQKSSANKIIIRDVVIPTINILQNVFSELLLVKTDIKSLYCRSKVNKSIDINNSTILSANIYPEKIERIHIEKSICNIIEIDGEYIKRIYLDETEISDKLNIIDANSHQYNKEYDIEQILIRGNKPINTINIMCTEESAIRVKDIELENAEVIEQINATYLIVDTLDIYSPFVYTPIQLNLRSIQIQNEISFMNLELKSSIFRNMNLSKFKFQNLLISDTKFYECVVDKIPDFPIIKINQIIPNVLSLILLIMIIGIGTINETMKQDFVIASLFSMFILIFLSMLIFIFMLYRHSATLDEDRENYSKATVKVFLNIIGKSIKSFFWKASDYDLQKIKEIESLNRQLKVAFEASKDTQHAHEFLYSEMLMKIRQKNIWVNLINVDFWNYLINGFGRRWRRALMNLLIMYFVAVSIFLFSSPFQFKVANQVPNFVREANQTVFRDMTKETFERGIVIQSSPENNATETKLNDGRSIITNLLGLTSIYTLSKFDIFKIKTAGWFEETSFWNFFKANIIGLILLFLLGSFILAFKRRLEK